MKILVINSGSSSIKYELFDMEKEIKLVSGIVEKIGDVQGGMTYKKFLPDGVVITKKEDISAADHKVGLNYIVALLLDSEVGAIKDPAEITAVGHRVVHGGENFKETTLINDQVISIIKKNIPLAPLHNPANLLGIEVSQEFFSEAKQFAVFDTAFHQTIPTKAFLYALPLELYQKEGVRRYGFHGTSHAYVAEKAAEFLRRPLKELNLITIHLGNGCSVAAIKNGECVDTSMGMTPLEGLVMGTRSGDIDPAIPFFLANHLKMSLSEIDILLNKESGLKGLCGSTDMREVMERYQSGDQQVQQAVDIYTYRIKKYIGAYYAVLGALDAIIFTAGIGENTPLIRQKCLENLGHLGITIDDQNNQIMKNNLREINIPNQCIKVLVIPTNEELQIAHEVKKFLDVTFGKL